jgi:hypothetical protein
MKAILITVLLFASTVFAQISQSQILQDRIAVLQMQGPVLADQCASIAKNASGQISKLQSQPATPEISHQIAFLSAQAKFAADQCAQKVAFNATEIAKLQSQLANLKGQ